MIKKSVITLFLLGILLVSPLVLAQEQIQTEEQTKTYAGFNKFTDNIKLAFSGGDNKVRLSLEIREKEIDSAISNSQNQNEKDAIKNLERAHKKLQIVNEKISLDVADEVKESVDEVVNKIEDEEDLSDNFDVYVLEEKRTQLMAELTQETFEYCKELASEDFALMLQEEKCDPETAPESLKKELEELKDIQIKLFVQLMLEIRSCIDDPGTCNCEANVDINQKAKCEKMVALAVKCEYKDDENACNELKSMESVEGDGFAESFVPGFLRNLFKEKSYMIDYDTEPSDGVPEECWDENDKPECKQYEYLKETNDDWDEYGNFIGRRPKNKEPTMRESIPQCFDENDNFLEEKCGNVTIVWNEEGLINYLVEGEIDDIIDEFENKSAQNTIDVNGSLGQAVWDVEKGIMDVEDDIENWVVDNPPKDVDDGLTWDIKTDIVKDVSGDDNGDDNGDDGGDNGDDVDDVDDGPGEPGVVDED